MRMFSLIIILSFINISPTYSNDLQGNKLHQLAWNQCTSDDNCGVDHKCCPTNDGTRCYRGSCPV